MLLIKVRMDNLKNARYKFTNKQWSDVSKGGKTFIASCLRKHPGSRLTANEALTMLQSEWVEKLEVSERAASEASELVTRGSPL